MLYVDDAVLAVWGVITFGLRLPGEAGKCVDAVAVGDMEVVESGASDACAGLVGGGCVSSPAECV